MTRQIHVGGIPIGGGAPVTIQSMTNTRTDDLESTLSQIRSLAAAGCQIVRVAVPDRAAARAVAKIKEASPLPVVVDIHFDYKLALEAIAAGADKVRGASQSASVSMAALWRRDCWPNTAASVRRPWWSQPSATSVC